MSHTCVVEVVNSFLVILHFLLKLIKQGRGLSTHLLAFLPPIFLDTVMGNARILLFQSFARLEVAT
jgi:hypothetical protein